MLLGIASCTHYELLTTPPPALPLRILSRTIVSSCNKLQLFVVTSFHSTDLESTPVLAHFTAPGNLIQQPELESWLFSLPPLAPLMDYCSLKIYTASPTHELYSVKRYFQQSPSPSFMYWLQEPLKKHHCFHKKNYSSSVVFSILLCSDQTFDGALKRFSPSLFFCPPFFPPLRSGCYYSWLLYHPIQVAALSSSLFPVPF